MPSLDETLTNGPWSDTVLRTRIADTCARTRYEAGSPNVTEVEAYDRGLGETKQAGIAVVLGMTPELRRLALERFARVLTVERSADAIALYSDWVPQESAPRENIVHADWFELASILREPAAAILGDGVFGNLPDLEAHRSFLRQLAQLLAPGAPLVLRKALIPRGFDSKKERFELLLERHRRGELDAAEFGFAARLLGHYGESYDVQRHVLHNARSFQSCEALYRAGRLEEHEWSAIRRYYFEGDNCILPQEVWEEVLAETGFDFALHRCQGRDWYRYYPVYACRRPRA